MPNRPLTGGVVVPQINFDPAGALEGVARLQTAKTAMEKAREESMARMRTQQLAQQYPDDPEGFIDALSREYPMQGAVYREKYYSGLKEQGQAQKAALEADKTALDTVIQLVQGSTPETWGIRRGIGVKIGGKVADQLLPQDFDQEKINALIPIALKAKDYLDLQQKATDDYLAGNKIKAAAELFAGSDTPEMWQATQQYLAQAGRQGQELSARFGEFTPENLAKAKNAALTEEQRRAGERAGTTEARQAEQFKATEARQEREFTVTSGIAAGHLGVARAGLALRQKEAAQPKAVSTKPSTGQERRALNFFNRAKQASDELETVEEEVSKMGLSGQLRMQLGATVPGGNIVQSQTGQTYTAAQRAFTEARLRKDSGAAIPEHEFENDRRTYFAQPGDSRTTIDQKRRMRAGVLASLGFEAGKAVGEFYGEEAEGLIKSYQDLAKGAATQKKTAAPGKQIIVKTPDGQEFPFETQAQADEFKRRAKIP